MKRNYSHDLGIMTVSEMVDFLKSLQETYGDWPIYCCGSDECYLCINEDEQYIVLDMEDLFEEFDDDEWLDDVM